MNSGLKPYRIYTVKQLASELDLSELTIKRRAQKGDFPHVKQFGKLYFWGYDIIRFIRNTGTPKGNPSNWEV